MADAQIYYPPPPPPPPPGYYIFALQDAGPYVRFGIGPSFFQDGKLTQFGTSANSPVRFDTGITANFAVGYAFNKFFSTDFETGFIDARINSVSGFAANNSTLSEVPFIVNARFSLPIPHSNIVPYFGAGAGGAAAVFDADTFNDGADFVTGSESDAVFAWQAFAGVRFNLNPQMSLGLGYKYFATGNPTFTYPPDAFNVGFQGVRTHSVLFTFEWRF